MVKKYITLFDKEKTLFFRFKYLSFGSSSIWIRTKAPPKSLGPDPDLLASLDLDPAPDSVIKIT